MEYPSIIQNGCTCDSCLQIRKKEIDEARERWNNNQRDIIFKSYHYQCSDDCCDEYGTDLYINGVKHHGWGGDPVIAIRALIEFLGIENVNIDYEYDDEM